MEGGKVGDLGWEGVLSCCLLACARQVGVDLLCLYLPCDAVGRTRSGHSNIRLGRETKFLTPKPTP